MKRYLILFLTLSTFLFAEAKHNHLAYDRVSSLIKSIDDKAIVLGNGQKDVYAFIDPMCRYSRKFIKTLSSNKSMLDKYRYHLFLYEIPRLHSQKVIYAIYQKKNRVQILLDVMLHDKHVVPLNNTPLVEEKRVVSDIAKVAKELDVFKRPYIIVSQESE